MLHIAALILIGLAYRATFVSQGFNATDEGWLLSVGRRIATGQVPYRDFDFVFPRTPFTIFKEAAFQAILGDSYTVLVQRWMFVAEATLGTVLAYLILKTIIPARTAWLVSVPTIFFSVLSYYFSFYTYDAAILVLLATWLLTLVKPSRWWPAWAAGFATCLAGLAKPNYFEFVLLVPAIGLLSARIGTSKTQSPFFGFRKGWSRFLGGVGIGLLSMLAGFTLAGALPALTRWPFPEPIRITASQSSASLIYQVGFAIWQDLPTVFPRRDIELFGLVLLLLTLTLVPALKELRWLALCAVPIGLFAYSYRYSADFLPMVLGLLLAINAFALVVGVGLRWRSVRSSPMTRTLDATMPPTEMVLLALTQQYLAQFSTSGIVYSYLGAYLSLPVALLAIRSIGLALAADSSFGLYRLAVALPAILLGVWLTVMSVNYVQNHVYFDAPRDQLTATFKTPKLAGIQSTPANVRRIDGVVEMIDRYSKPGDPILVMPDLSCMYYLTDRVNPTRQDWLGYIDLTRGEETPVQDVELHPPKVVIVQTVSEYDWSRSRRPDYVLDYSKTDLASLYQYLTENYVQVGTVGDMMVLVPKGSAT